jgi:hypothetical protein
LSRPCRGGLVVRGSTLLRLLFVFVALPPRALVSGGCSAACPLTVALRLRRRARPRRLGRWAVVAAVGDGASLQQLVRRPRARWRSSRGQNLIWPAAAPRCFYYTATVLAAAGDEAGRVRGRAPVSSTTSSIPSVGRGQDFSFASLRPGRFTRLWHEFPRLGPRFEHAPAGELGRRRDSSRPGT